MKKAWVMYSARIPRLAVLLGSSWLFVTGNVLADCVDFSDYQVLVAETGSTTVRSGDLDGDGDQDLITANRTGGADESGSVSIFLNNGDGSFAPANHLPLLPGDEYPRSIAVADLDGDGDLDLVTANWLSASATIFVNDGSGAFELMPLTTFQNPTAVAAADLNGDALPEIIITLYAANGACGGHLSQSRPYLLPALRAVTRSSTSLVRSRVPTSMTMEISTSSSRVDRRTRWRSC